MKQEVTPQTFGGFVKKHLKWIIAGGIALVVVIIAVSVISTYMNTRNEGKRQEQSLTALYNQSMNSLSTCLDQGQTAAQVTQKEYESIKDILVGTVSARYVDETGAPTDASGVLGGGKLISALQEAYPQIDQRSWQNLQTIVVGCRDEFQGTQDRIQTYAANYNKWRVTTDLSNFWIKSGFPSDELKVRTANGDTLYGQAAYDRITRVVSVADATTAFETGQLGEQDLFGNK